jgi:hypothetical protein
MGYLTIYTRSNRVVIISSVITRIVFYSVQCLDGRISTYSIKTLVIYLCCALYSCASYSVHYFIIVARYYYCCSFILFVVRLFRSFFVQLLLSFDSLLFIYSLFIVHWSEWAITIIDIAG